MTENQKKLGLDNYVGSAGEHISAELIKRYIEDQDSEREGFEPSS